MQLKKKSFAIHEVEPYINWLYFFHAWQLSGKPDVQRKTLKHEADEMLREMDTRFRTHVSYGLFKANGEGDDLVLADGRRIPMLRQQMPTDEGQPCLCLSDFVRPLSSNILDTVGIFAATVDAAMEHYCRDDAYRSLLAQTLADRLVEATVEKQHEDIRRKDWGYAPDEQLSVGRLHREEYQGIRPAVGYPSLPDTSVNFLLYELVDMPSIGIQLTENGMMMPHASVSGFMFAHPQARYFELGRIGEDQLRDYAHRRGMPVEVLRKFLSSSLMRTT